MPIYACEVGRGNCTDFHSLFIGLARAAGIPARFVMGFPLPVGQSEGGITGYHCWAEFYDEGLGWVPLDASVNDGLGCPQNDGLRSPLFVVQDVLFRTWSLPPGSLPSPGKA
jgi:hypothetical protein